MKTYVILGATGNTGSVVADQLLLAKQKVRVVGRSAEKLARFAKQGAEIFVGDQADANFLATVFSGADAAYLLIPPHMTTPDYHAYADQLTDAFISAIQKSGLKNVVLLSSLGAEHATGTGPIAGLHRAEQRLKALADVNTIALRAGYFMSNLFGSLGMIKHAGINGGVTKAAVPIAMIAPLDIGIAASKLLLNFSAKGFVVQELSGAREITSAEATALLGKAIDKPELPYIEFTDEQFFGGLTGAGLSASMASMYVEMSHGMNKGLIRANNGTPTRGFSFTPFEEFLPVLAGAYKAM